MLWVFGETGDGDAGGGGLGCGGRVVMYEMIFLERM